VLIKSNLWGVVVALDLSRVVFRRIQLNMLFSLGFNVLGIPIAAGALYASLHTRLPPELAALAMALSSVSVVTSSLLLRRYRAPTCCCPLIPNLATQVVPKQRVDIPLLPLSRDNDALPVPVPAPAGAATGMLLQNRPSPSFLSSRHPASQPQIELAPSATSYISQLSGDRPL
jgi:hypothetical protein